MVKEMMTAAPCVEQCNQPNETKWGTATVSYTAGCENVQIAVSGTGQQLVVSCFSKWDVMGED